MTKCEQAQKGIESMLEKLESLCERQVEGQYYTKDFEYAKEK